MNFLLLISGGTGKRFGQATPKQYHKNKNGKMIIEQSIENFNSDEFEGAVVVSSEEYKDVCCDLLAQNGFKNVLWAPSGKERTDSIRNGVNALVSKFGTGDKNFVFVQEAVRPFVTRKMIDALVNFDDSKVAVSPAVHPVVLYANLNEDGSQSLIQKTNIVELQLPKRLNLSIAHELINNTQKDSSVILDETELFLDAGHRISFVPGEQSNIKITYFEDLNVLNKLTD